MRVGQVVRPAAGGIRRHVSTLVEHLDASEFDATLFAPPDFALDLDATAIPRRDTPIAAKTNFKSDVATIRLLARALRGHVDIVHAHGLRAAWVGVLAARRAGVPALFTAHNLVPSLNPISRFCLRVVGRFAAGGVAVSQAVADGLAQAGLDASKIVVIPNGIDLAPFDVPVDTAAVRARYGVRPDASLTVSVGRLSPEKGFDVLLSVLPIIQQGIPNVQAVIAGSGPEEASLRQFAQGLPVLFPGRVENVPELMACADVVVIPSREEGQGIVALEAMAARRAVVASRVGGLVETVLDGETGLLVSANAPAIFAEAVVSLLNDPPRREAFGAAGRERVERLYTAERMTAQIADLYRKYAKY